MSYSLGLTCEICGARISDDNPDGIGYGCRTHIKLPAEAAAVKEFYSDFNLQLWILKGNEIKNFYLETFKDVKFRNAFKKSFYESMSKAERVSKKQLDIMNKQLKEKAFFDGYFNEEYEAFEENLSKKIKTFYLDKKLEAKSANPERWETIYSKYKDIFFKKYFSGNKKAETEE